MSDAGRPVDEAIYVRANVEKQLGANQNSGQEHATVFELVPRRSAQNLLLPIGSRNSPRILRLTPSIGDPRRGRIGKRYALV